MDQDTQAIVDIVTGVLSAGGPWAVLGALLTGLLRLLRLPLVQSLLVAINPKLGWEAWPQWVKWALPFVLAGGATFVPALVAGGGWIPALVGALVAGVSAVTLHTGTKAAGSALDNAAVAKNPEYQPGVIRKAVSPVLPVDEKALQRKLMNAFNNR